jgi:hypothetical protein
VFLFTRGGRGGGGGIRDGDGVVHFFDFFNQTKDLLFIIGLIFFLVFDRFLFDFANFLIHFCHFFVCFFDTDQSTNDLLETERANIHGNARDGDEAR